MRNKERRAQTTKKNKTNKQLKYKEGLGPSEVALQATSPDPQTLPKNQKKKQKKTNKEGV